MSEWSTDFQTILDELESATAIAGSISDTQKVMALLNAFALSWQHENDCMVWIVTTNGNNTFGAEVIFVNNKVLNKLGWTMEEWTDGTASDGLMDADEDERFIYSLHAKSSLPAKFKMNKKGGGDIECVVFVIHDLPNNLRLTVGLEV
jgi:hypothetical protein